MHAMDTIILVLNYNNCFFEFYLFITKNCSKCINTTLTLSFFLSHFKNLRKEEGKLSKKAWGMDREGEITDLIL